MKEENGVHLQVYVFLKWDVYIHGATLNSTAVVEAVASTLPKGIVLEGQGKRYPDGVPWPLATEPGTSSPHRYDG